MTPNEINIAIAEACGFCFCRSEASGGVGQWHNADGEIVHTLPDYYNDLNACHEAQRHLLDDDLYLDFVRYLTQPTFCDRPSYSGYVVCADANASQRCEALLRTLGKWNE